MEVTSLVVICVNAKETWGITEGKLYTVVGESEKLNGYLLAADDGLTSWYSRNRFQIRDDLLVGKINDGQSIYFVMEERL